MKKFSYKMEYMFFGFRNGEASKTDERGLLFYDDLVREPILSERAASFSGCLDIPSDRHVQFIVG